VVVRPGRRPHLREDVRRSAPGRGGLDPAPNGRGHFLRVTS